MAAALGGGAVARRVGQGRLHQGVHGGGLVQPVGPLHRVQPHVGLERRPRVGPALGDEGQSSSTPLLAGPAPGGQGLGPGDEDAGPAAAGHQLGGPVDEPLRDRSRPCPSSGPRPPPAPRRRASSGAGSPWRSDREWTIQQWVSGRRGRRRLRRRLGERPGARGASAMSSKGSGAAAGSSSRLVTWPAPTTTGTLVQSIVGVTRSVHVEALETAPAQPVPRSVATPGSCASTVRWPRSAAKTCLALVRSGCGP